MFFLFSLQRKKHWFTQCFSMAHFDLRVLHCKPLKLRDLLCLGTFFTRTYKWHFFSFVLSCLCFDEHSNTIIWSVYGLFSVKTKFRMVYKDFVHLATLTPTQIFNSHSIFTLFTNSNLTNCALVIDCWNRQNKPF